MDNSLADAPLVLFDSQKFTAYEYEVKESTFLELPLIDTENFAERIPKDFKSIYIGGALQSFLLVGGFDVRKEQTSNAAFLYQKGKLREVIEMYTPRQFFGICSTLMTELAAPSSQNIDSNTQQQIYDPGEYQIADKSAEKEVTVFVVGGYNNSKGCLNQVESFSSEQKTWRQHT